MIYLSLLIIARIDCKWKLYISCFIVNLKLMFLSSSSAVHTLTG